MNASAIRLFQYAAYAWLALYMLALLTLGPAAWTNAPVDLFSPHENIGGAVMSLINGLSPFVCMVLSVLVLSGAVALVHRHRWWLGLIAWFLFRVITHRTWLASNGGVQLMENMLLWSALMTERPLSDQLDSKLSDHISLFAFWAARLQLLLVYAVAAAHKFTGTAWLDGSAVLTVARDNDFHLHWLTAFPLLCHWLTYATLAFMCLFPFAVWWKRSRRVFLLIGILFHLSTAIFMDIPQMGLAFIACYALWLSDEEAARIAALPTRIRARFA